MYYTGGENEGRQRCDEEAKEEEKREAEHTEGVDDAFVLLCYVVHAADPLAAIAQRPDALDEMRGLEGRDEKSPGERKVYTASFRARYASSETRETSTAVVVGSRTHTWCIACSPWGTFNPTQGREI
jgi:hypothetical protein